MEIANCKEVPQCFSPVGDRRYEVHEDERRDGLEVEEDAVEDAAPEVGAAEALEEGAEVHQVRQGRELDDQGGQAGVELELRRAAKAEKDTKLCCFNFFLDRYTRRDF